MKKIMIRLFENLMWHYWLTGVGLIIIGVCFIALGLCGISGMFFGVAILWPIINALGQREYKKVTGKDFME